MLPVCFKCRRQFLLEPDRLSVSVKYLIFLLMRYIRPLLIRESLYPLGIHQIARACKLLSRAKFLSYSVSSEAERVFQARENIKVARGNLLPKLSLRAVVGAFTGDYLSVVSSALPFIFPNNWYRLDEANSLFLAERNLFASLRGNEMNFV